ncbi:MAG: response regulator [Oscillospiraceae bacterium]|nr:response regulator [Oscillospiraceae bacterium]
MGGARKTVYIVDDNHTNLTSGRNMLMTFYQVIPAMTAQAMFENLEKVVPDLILLDIEMPGMDGYEAMRRLKSDARWAEVPVIFLTAKDDADSEIEGLDLGAVDYIKKPFVAPLLLKRIEKELLFHQQRRELIETQKELRHHLENLEELVLQKTETVMMLHNAVFDTVIEMVEFRDNYTGGHITRTQMYLRVLLDEIGKGGVYAGEVAGWDMGAILTASKLHDVGKIAVSDTILGKNGKFTEEEYAIMKTHVTVGVDAIEKIVRKTGEDTFYNHAIRMAGTHHEKWDGGGYPIGLKGANIPLEGRLMAIADVYDALISKRQYKDPMPHEKACAIIEEGSGTHFDPALIEVFGRVKGRFAEAAGIAG